MSATYPGAVEPERAYDVEVPLGARLHVVEWGDPAAPPLLCAHGFWDHARSFVTVAPLLAARFRVIAYDARGHGDSDWMDGYGWHAHIHDMVSLIRRIGTPLHLVGHSMGGGQVVDAARCAPELVRQVVNIDGFGPPPMTEDEIARLPERFAAFLDQRRAVAERPHWKPYPTITELATRRRKQNPRLSLEWLSYFAFHGARESHDGWRWKSDPQLGQGFGPWRSDWINPTYRRLQAPLLAVVGSEQDTWGPLPAAILAERLDGVPRLTQATIAGAGHFVHIEQPRDTAALLLDWLEA